MKIVIQKQTEMFDHCNRFREDIFSQIKSKKAYCSWEKISLDDVRKVAIINSSPRSGSSMLFSVLRNIPNFYSLNGESVPYLKLSGWCRDFYPDDSINIKSNILSLDNTLARDLISDFTIYEHSIDLNDVRLRTKYVYDLLLRFSLQWPLLKFDFKLFEADVSQALDSLPRGEKPFPVQLSYIKLLTLLRRRYPMINPYYYDIPEKLIKRYFADIAIPSGPLNDYGLIEEPPFICIIPRRSVNLHDLENKCLLLKSPVNCYRMDFIKQLFSNAEIRIIHLTRNPGAVISSLYDGWCYRGFFSHNLKVNPVFKKSGKPLNIRGYSEKFHWGKHWWNFDLPPNWHEINGSSLEEVCAFQWTSANRKILNYLSENKVSSYLVRYENFLNGSYERRQVLKDIVLALGYEGDDVSVGSGELPVVQITRPPVLGKWKEKKDIIEPIVRSKNISNLACSLGYNIKEINSWV